MEPTSRKRNLPRIVTNCAEKRRSIGKPVLPTPEAQEGDVKFKDVCKWDEALEKEIELRMKTLPNEMLFA